MSFLAINYYDKRFGSDIQRAFIHLTREMGELALSIERDNREMAKVEITELTAMMFYMAHKYGFDLMESMEALYRKKVEAQQKASLT